MVDRAQFDAALAFALVSQASVAKLTSWRAKHSWPHRWVPSHDTTYHHDRGWTEINANGDEGQLPGYF